MQVLVFCDFGLKTPIHAPFGGIFGAQFPQKMSLIVLTPKRTVPGRNHVIWAIKREYRARGSSWALDREKKGQDRKKSHKRVSPIWGEAPTRAICVKNCVVGDLLDVITCAKFQNEIFRGYDFTGVRTFHFPIDFWMGLTTVQRYCAACDAHDFLNVYHSETHHPVAWQKLYREYSVVWVYQTEFIRIEDLSSHQRWCWSYTGCYQ